MLTFEAPGFFLLFIFVPLFIYLRHFYLNSGRSLRISIGLWRKGMFTAPQRGIHFFLTLSALFFWGGICLLLASLAGPTVSLHEKVYLNRGADIMIVLDQSPSMAARDFPPENRLDAAKKMIRKFVLGRINDGMGLVGFGDEAVLKVPPTTDYSTFLERLETMTILELGEGTAIGMGLSVAALHLSDSSASEKVIVLLTDGDNNAGEIQPLAAASMASQMGIRIYVIGIGSEGEVPFEFTHPETGKLITGIQRSLFNEPFLAELAETGNGSFYRAFTPGSLEAVFRSIDSLETLEERVRIHVRNIPVHRWFILLGISFIFIDFIIRKILFREVL